MTPVEKLVRQLAPLLLNPEGLREDINSELAARDAASQAQPSPDLLERHNEACRARDAIVVEIEAAKSRRAEDAVSLASAESPDTRMLYRQRLAAHDNMLALLGHRKKEADRGVANAWAEIQANLKSASRRAIVAWRGRMVQQRDAAKARLDVAVPEAVKRLLELAGFGEAEQTAIRQWLAATTVLEADGPARMAPQEHIDRACGLYEPPNPLTYVPRRREPQPVAS